MPPISAIVDRLQARLGPASGTPQPLEGGITNRNYRVRFGERDYVVRLPGKDTALLGISRAAERLANQTAASLGIAPPVTHADEEYIVTEFVPGFPADVDAGLEEIARALRAFHDCRLELPVRFWVPDLLAQYADVVHARGGVLPGGYAPAQALARRIAQALPLADPVACHDDLLAANILRSHGRIMIVDWEYAGMGHRLFDLGNFAVNNDFDDDAEERLLAAYFDQAPTRGHRAALKLMRLMSDAREAAWGVVQGVVSELDFDFGQYAAKHFSRLARAGRSPELDDWLRDAAAA